MNALRCRVLHAAWATMLLIAPLRAARAEQAPPRLDHTAVPTGESVDLTCDPEESDYTGTVSISLGVKQSTDALRFHGRGLTVDSATLRGPLRTVQPSAVEPPHPQP